MGNNESKAALFMLLAAGLLAGSLEAQGAARFPEIKATSLAGRDLELPRDFGSPASLVFVAFAMKQQADIDAWKPFVDAQRAKRPALPVWELPTIGPGYKFMRGVIEGGMRSGIKSEAARASTVTVYVDAADFSTRIGSAGLGEIAVLVVAPDGRILARAAGRPDAVTEGALARAIGTALDSAR
jgi:hypothetical protein